MTSKVSPTERFGTPAAAALIERLAPLATPAAWAVLLLGVVLRIGQFASGRSLWLDEAMLALNIVHRTPFDLVARPLDYTQGAPIGFLLLAKLGVWVFGPSDAALRLVPLLGGVAGLFLMWRLARRVLGGLGPLIALTLFAVSEGLIYYAAEAKQYSTDVGVALALWLGGLWVMDTGLKPRAYLTLGVVGAIGVWASHPAPFVLTGVGTAIGLATLQRRDRALLPWLALMSGLWVASFGAAYFVSLRTLAANAELLDYWQGMFLPMPLWSSGPWLVHALARFLWNPSRLPHVTFGAVVLLFGCATLARANWRAAVMLLLPFLAVLAASALHKYPFGDRLVLFLVPVVLLLLAAATEGVRRLLWARSVPLAVASQLAVALTLLYAPTFDALYALKHPRTREEIKPVLAYLTQHRLPGDDVFVYDGAMYAFMYYAPRYGFQSGDYRTGICVRRGSAECDTALEAVRGHRRVWFVFSHDWSDREPQFQAQLDTLGSKRDQFTAPGASVILYDLGARAAVGSTKRRTQAYTPSHRFNPAGPV